MDKDNSNLLHGFFFAIAALLLVYAGEQLSRQPNYQAAWAFKIAVVSGIWSILSVGYSFLPATASTQHNSERLLAEKTYRTIKEKEELKPELLDVAKQCGRHIGREETLQNTNDLSNQMAMKSALISAMIESVMFGIGVWLL